MTKVFEVRLPMILIAVGNNQHDQSYGTIVTPGERSTLYGSVGQGRLRQEVRFQPLEV